MTELVNILTCVTGGAPLVPVAMIAIRRGLFLLGLDNKETSKQVNQQTSKEVNKLTSKQV